MQPSLVLCDQGAVSSLRRLGFALLIVLCLGCAVIPASATTYWYNSYTQVWNNTPATQPFGSTFVITANFSSNASLGYGCGIDGWCTYYYGPGGHYAVYDNGVLIRPVTQDNQWTEYYDCATDREGNPVQCGADHWESTITLNDLRPGTHTIRVDFTGECGTIYGNWCFHNSTASIVLNVTTGAGLQITTASLPAGTVGIPYTAALVASGGVSPYSWAIVGGTLPAGLNIDSQSGLISGTPNTAGTYAFTARVTDSTANTAIATLSITINNQSTTQCGIAVYPEVLGLVSVDYYSYYDGSYLGSTYGEGVVTALSSYPTCTQVGYEPLENEPLVLLADYGPPIPYSGSWLTQYLWGDDGGGFIPFYPFVTDGVMIVYGLDVTNGQAYLGYNTIVLTIFAEEI